jgi:uncharacterized protein
MRVLLPSGQRTNSEDRSLVWAPDLAELRLPGATLVTSPRLGGWGVLDPGETSPVGPKAAAVPAGAAGRLLVEARLAVPREEPAAAYPAEPPEDLFFFEFSVTTGCNLACDYCFVDAAPAHLGNKAPLELAERLIDRIAEHRVASRSTTRYVIEFTGGEPMLNFPVVRHAVEYAERTYGDALGAGFVMQSNLTALSKDILAFCRAHKVGIGVSYDGHFQDRHRPLISKRPSTPSLTNHLRDLADAYPENRGGVISVVTQEVVKELPELILFLYLRGFSSIVLRPMESVGRGRVIEIRRPFHLEFAEQLFRALVAVIEPLYREYGTLVEERLLGLTFQHLLTAERPFMCERTPCGAGRNICVIEPDGMVYGCNQTVRDVRFTLGNVYEQTFAEMLRSDAAMQLKERKLEQLECSSCLYKSWCQSPCPATSTSRYGQVLAKSGDCELYMSRYGRALQGLITDEFDLEVVGQLAGLDE